uniref:C2 domain-containing protein n=1 Tax=Clastoptera arizonana TaxID=38151 RepID=A0A1B6DN18_9HEMI
MHQGGSELVIRMKTKLARLGRSNTEDGEPKKNLLRHILNKASTVDDSNDTESKQSADEEDSDNEPRGRDRPEDKDRSGGQTPPPDFFQNMPIEGLMEKLGNHLKERSDKVHKYFQRNSKITDANRRLKSQIWSSVVTIVLVEGKNLMSNEITSSSDFFVKFRLGNEKYKSKVINKTQNPHWLEQFDLHLYDDQSQELEVSVWDKDRSKDEFIGRCSIDLSELEREKTHRMKKNLEESGEGSIFLLLTISGTTASETISDLTTYEENCREKLIIEDRYSLKRTFHNLKDVGHLTVRVYKAQGLFAADINGKSDPFCVLELINSRLQTQTEYKTLTPSWQKIFTFNVKDIHSVLEVTVYDEDRDHKVEFLGKVAIPLLRIKNCEKRWYALKDKKIVWAS